MRILTSVALALGLIGAAQSQLPAGFTDVPLVTGLNLPTGMAFAPDGRMFILEKAGGVKIFKNGTLLATPFATINCDSTFGRGLLGDAFDPNFATNHFVYLYYTAGLLSVNPPLTPKNRVSRFVADGDLVTAGSETVLLDNIESDSGSDNGGTIRFGLDNKLWISTGDGGTTITLSQNLQSLAGKLLRINSDGSLPVDNPFVGVPNTRSEIWAYGFRNPFRFSFRPGTNVPYVADVGEHTWEELNIAVPGGNFGWPQAEGNSVIGGLINPVFSYNHTESSKCITGGLFAKSFRFPTAYANRYIYADYKVDKLYYVDFNTLNQVVGQGTFGPSAHGPVDFAIQSNGSLYYVAILEKTVHKISYEPAVSALVVPAAVDGGSIVQGSVTISAVAPVGAQAVNLLSSNPAVLSVPSKVSVISGQTTATFAVTTQPVTTNATVSVSATIGTSSISRSVSVVANGVKAVYLQSTSVFAGANVISTVVLKMTPSQAAVVQVTSSSPAVSVPATVTLPAGVTSKGFTVHANGVTASTIAFVICQWAGASSSRPLTVDPAFLSDLLVNPNPIQGGVSGVGTARLSGPAGPGGVVINLTDNTSLIGTPPSVSIPAQVDHADFTFTTVHVTADTIRTMTAKYKTFTRTVTVTLKK